MDPLFINAFPTFFSTRSPMFLLFKPTIRYFTTIGFFVTSGFFWTSGFSTNSIYWIDSGSSLPRDSSTQVDSSHYNVLTNVQPSMVTSRTTKRNVSAFLLDSDNNSDNDDQENQAILNNN